MTREIKFRAWDIRNSKMVDNALVLGETHQLVTVHADYFNTPFSFFDGCKWMQYTGYKDKKGVEIYEGDFLRCGKHTALVVFVEGAFVFRNRIGEWLDEWNWADDSNRFEVIGHYYKESNG